MCVGTGGQQILTGALCTAPGRGHSRGEVQRTGICSIHLFLYILYVHASSASIVYPFYTPTSLCPLYLLYCCCFYLICFHPFIATLHFPSHPCSLPLWRTPSSSLLSHSLPPCHTHPPSLSHTLIHITSHPPCLPHHAPSPPSPPLPSHPPSSPQAHLLREICTFSLALEAEDRARCLKNLSDYGFMSAVDGMLVGIELIMYTYVLLNAVVYIVHTIMLYTSSV